VPESPRTPAAGQRASGDRTPLTANESFKAVEDPLAVRERIEEVPEIFRRLEAVGLQTTEACGDCPRVILGSPLPVEDYGARRRTGAFCLIDPQDGNTVAAGTVRVHLPTEREPLDLPVEI